VARFVLQPCKLREDWIVPVKDTQPITVDWRELCAQLAPSRDLRALQVLRMLQVNSFVGLTKNPRGGAPTNFVLLNVDRSGNLEKVIAKDKTFGQRLLTVFRVEDVLWDTKVVELPGEGPRPS